MTDHKRRVQQLLNKIYTEANPTIKESLWWDLYFTLRERPRLAFDWVPFLHSDTSSIPFLRLLGSRVVDEARLWELANGCPDNPNEESRIVPCLEDLWDLMTSPQLFEPDPVEISLPPDSKETGTQGEEGQRNLILILKKTILHIKHCVKICVKEIPDFSSIPHWLAAVHDALQKIKEEPKAIHVSLKQTAGSAAFKFNSEHHRVDHVGRFNYVNVTFNRWEPSVVHLLRETDLSSIHHISIGPADPPFGCCINFDGERNTYVGRASRRSSEGTALTLGGASPASGKAIATECVCGLLRNAPDLKELRVTYTAMDLDLIAVAEALRTHKQLSYFRWEMRELIVGSAFTDLLIEVKNDRSGYARWSGGHINMLYGLLRQSPGNWSLIADQNHAEGKVRGYRRKRRKRGSKTTRKKRQAVACSTDEPESQRACTYI
ncbi:expressed unknown protein [Seminavis robusta]|uniref:Uncharacterized protein n=1 Tax=Seminavis robusta TaxID=568900 RepID=A0A9N8HE42_9STRA|nr:expressed unknown protein [Seminavis robusta]|eukprot:Sro286_g108340.1 n/a (434) ;mRNA; r:44891-46352